jgi:hypothetical protein
MVRFQHLKGLGVLPADVTLQQYGEVEKSLENMERTIKLGDIATHLTKDAESKSKPRSETENEQWEQLTVTVSLGNEEVSTQYLPTQNETV